jgi:hypothetical protein
MSRDHIVFFLTELTTSVVLLFAAPIGKLMIGESLGLVRTILSAFDIEKTFFSHIK